jgi:hypothetical protein
MGEKQKKYDPAWDKNSIDKYRLPMYIPEKVYAALLNRYT